MSPERDFWGHLRAHVFAPFEALKKSAVPWLVIEPESMRILASNPAAHAWFNIQEVELNELCLTDLLQAEDLVAAIEFIQGADSSRQTRIWSFYQHASVPLQAQLMTLPLSGSASLLMVGIVDVTERERLRAERDQLLERYEALAVQSQQYFWEWDLVGGTIRRSAGLLESLGFTERDTVQTVDWWEDRIHPADRERVKNSIFRAVEDKRLNWSAEYRFLKASGQYAHIYDQGIVTLDQFGKPSRIIGSMFDITDAV